MLVQCRRCGNVWQQRWKEPPLDRCQECGAGPDEHRREGLVTHVWRRSVEDPRQSERR
jgi:predicted  nucleic acid-binding Zn-ribbon protein